MDVGVVRHSDQRGAAIGVVLQFRQRVKHSCRTGPFYCPQGADLGQFDDLVYYGVSCRLVHGSSVCQRVTSIKDGTMEIAVGSIRLLKEFDNPRAFVIREMRQRKRDDFFPLPSSEVAL